MEENGHFWHVQQVTSIDSAATVATGLRRGLGLELTAFWRHFTTRIRFEDADRRPLVLPQGDIHHRNETLAGIADPWLVLHAARGVGEWTVAGRAGVSLPLGRTEPNPFALGRQGLPHQHVQFGTGTVDPILSAGLGRRIGSSTLTLTTLARLTVASNSHGYQAGNRYQAGLDLHRSLGSGWHGGVGTQVVRDQAETWDGIVEEEGNLGRTDVLLGLSLTRVTQPVGGLTLSVQVPLLTRAHGAQLDYPVIVSLGVAR